MDSKTITQIVDWIKERCSDWEDDTFAPGMSPAEIFLKFLADPSAIDEYYPDVVERSGMCDFIHTKGECKSVSCQCEVVPGTNRCEYHSHAIFSKETLAYIRSLHLKYNTAYDDNHHKLAAPPKANTLTVKHYRLGLTKESLYREQENGLIVKFDREQPVCIGYSTDDNPDEQLPLTPELEAYCLSVGLALPVKQVTSEDPKMPVVDSAPIIGDVSPAKESVIDEVPIIGNA